jgi:hypothetical protein
MIGGISGCVPPGASVGVDKLGLVLDRRYFMPLLVTRTPWLDGFHALDTNMCPALFVSLYPLILRIMLAGFR